MNLSKASDNIKSKISNKKKYYIGRSEKRNVYISTETKNPHVLITGNSGSGKTTMQLLLQLQAIKYGMVIAINSHDTYTPDKIFKGIRDQYIEKINLINVEDNGLPIGLFSESEVEKDKDVYQALRTLEFALPKIGNRQWNFLQKVLYDSYPSDKNADKNQMEAIDYTLKSYENSEEDKEVVLGVKRILTPLLKFVKIIPRKNLFQTEKINIIDISMYSDEIQNILFNLILGILWRMGKDNGRNRNALHIFTDELQGINVKIGSPLNSIIKEGRKYGVALYAACQDLSCFTAQDKATLNQAATHIYFTQNPVDAKAASDLTEISKLKLTSLPVGTCAIIGNLIKGEECIQKELVDCTI